MKLRYQSFTIISKVLPVYLFPQNTHAGCTFKTHKNKKYEMKARNIQNV